MKRYKFLRKGLKSENGNFKWKLGEWYTHEGDIEMCSSGFHCSKGIYQAFSYVQGEILAEVEVKGEHQTQDDKEVWEKMRLTKTYKWTKKDSVLFSIYCAYLCLYNFEKEHPDDKRPRQAIEAAEKWIKNPTNKNQLASWSAAESARSAAESARIAAESARLASWSAAESARIAAESARLAARSSARLAARSSARSSAESARIAAESAWSASWSAWLAARSSARSSRSSVYKKLDKWMLEHLKELKVIKEI